MNTNANVTMTQSGNGIAFGLRASGAYAMRPCALFGIFTDGPTHKRHVDVATEHQGTLVWSPPT
jgi:hypothetical protein